MKVSTFEVVNVKGKEFGPTIDRWHELRHKVRLVRNSLTGIWFNHHMLQDSPILLSKWMKLDREWAKYTNDLQRWKILPKKKRGEKPKKPRGKTRPKRPVEALPADLNKQMYAEMARRFPELNTRFISYIIQVWRSNLINKNATNSAYKAWICVLVGMQSRESADRDAPIPFDRQLCEIYPPNGEEKFFTTLLRLSRIPPQNGSSQGTVINDHLVIRCGGKKIRSQLVLLERIVEGIGIWDTFKAADLQWRKDKKTAEKNNVPFIVSRPEPPTEAYQFKGSQLIFRENKRKWFLALAYEMPPREANPKLDPHKVAFLQASMIRPLTLRLPGSSYRFWPGGNGEYIGHKREKTFLQRRARSSNYRYANTNGKGHGHDRAHKWRNVFQTNWNDFTKTVNGQMASSIVEELLQKGIGQLVYFEPDEKVRGKRFLSRVGKGAGWNDATTWDWYGLKKQLREACDKNFIKFIEKPVGVKRKKYEDKDEDKAA